MITDSGIRKVSVKIKYPNFNINLASMNKLKRIKNTSKTVIGIVVKIDDDYKVGINISKDGNTEYLVLPFDEESILTKKANVVFNNDTKPITKIYKQVGIPHYPYKVFGFGHLVKGVIKTLSDNTKVFVFHSDEGKNDEIPINNL